MLIRFIVNCSFYFYLITEVVCCSGTYICPQIDMCIFLKMYVYVLRYCKIVREGNIIIIITLSVLLYVSCWCECVWVLAVCGVYSKWRTAAAAIADSQAHWGAIYQRVSWSADLAAHINHLMNIQTWPRLFYYRLVTLWPLITCCGRLEHLYLGAGK